MTTAVEQMASHLNKAGAVVGDLPDDLFDFETIGRNHRVIMAAEAAAGHVHRLNSHREYYAPQIKSLVVEGLAISATDYIRCREDQRRRSTNLLEAVRKRHKYDAILMAATVGPAPGPETTGDPVFNSPWSYLGWPTLSFPIGLSSDGLPLAIQIVGPSFFGEDELFRIAAWCESVIRRVGHGTSS